MSELLFIRHALPESGPIDPGLAAPGRDQAIALARWLAADPQDGIDAIAVSPLVRARQTAAELAGVLGLAPTEFEDLREWRRPVPAEAYVPVEQLAADDPRTLAIAEGRYEDFVPDLDAGAFRAQAARVVPQLTAAYPAARVAVVCHGGLINAVLGSLLGIDRLFWFNVRYTSVSRVVVLPNGRAVVDSLNEVPHLRTAIG